MPKPRPGVRRRIVDRPQEARIAGDVGHDLAPVPHMVAGGDDIDAGGVELGADLVGDAEAVRRVLAIRHDEVERELAPEARHRLDHGVAPGAAHNVAAQHHPHRALSLTGGNEDGAASAVGMA